MELATAHDVELDAAIDKWLYRLACQHSLSEMLGCPPDEQEKTELEELFFHLHNAEKQYVVDPAVSTDEVDSLSAIHCWLRTNRISAELINQLLTRIPVFSFAARSGNAQALDISAADCWQIAASALANVFPGLTRIVDEIALAAPRHLTPNPVKHPLPFTHDRGWGELPFVSVQFKGQAQDIISVAHEMAHAVQIVASQRGNNFYSYDMPAIARETCAFLGELAMLEYLKSIDSSIAQLCREAWLRESFDYLVVDSENLRDAVATKAGDFDYRWNYPVARLLACYFWVFDKNRGQTFFHAGCGADLAFHCKKMVE